jgi:tetratricopeptide (TPR) repeat protein
MFQTTTMGRAAAAAMVCFALVGCFGGEDRAERHAEQAAEHLDAGRFDEALIDLHSALKLDPTRADYAEQIATLLALRDDLDEARFYFGETYRLDPSRERAAVNLALLLFGSDPDQADALLDEVLARDPNSGWGWIGRAEQALLDFDTETALAAAQASIEFAPDLAYTYWELARVHIARIRER